MHSLQRLFSRTAIEVGTRLTASEIFYSNINGPYKLMSDSWLKYYRYDGSKPFVFK